jgi:hypothetical protein
MITTIATTDESNIPIGPADEEPDKPIPDNENETDDDDLFISDPDDDNDNPETWINWVTTPGGKDIRNGGTTTSTKVVVDFQGTVSQDQENPHRPEETTS